MRVDEKVKKANEGDTDAMCYLGDCYTKGDNGLVKDLVKAYQWYDKAADLYCPAGLIKKGKVLIYGIGVEQNESQGLILVGLAAGLGSDEAALYLGGFYHAGMYGFPKDAKKAKHWYRQVLDGGCSNDLLKETKIRLQMLEEESV